MPVFEPVISGIGYGPGDGLELFEATDIYRWDIDNRPLENLYDNDAAIKAAVDALVAEISASYDGTFWPTGTANTFGTLEGRLDNMDDFLAELFEIRNVQYSSFIQTAAFLRERFTSGFLNGPYPDTFIRSNFSMENNEIMPSPFGGFYVPESASSVQREDQPDQEVSNLVAMETRIEQDGSIWTATTKPIYIHVNGFIVPLLNAHGGTRELDQSVDDRRAAGVFGPVTIGFPAAPNTGHRFDFSFLEVWLQEIPQENGIFYPYGSRDFSTWSGRQQLAAADDLTTTWSGQFPLHRAIVREDEAWGLKVFLRDDTSAINWGAETPVCEDNGSTSLVDTGETASLAGDPAAVCNGTINYETGEWSITFTGYTPPTPKVLVAVYRYNGVADPDTASVRGTITFLPSGNYLQVQHKIRVVPGVNYASYPDWFSDPTVEARAGAALPVTNYTYLSGLNQFHDGSLWYAGDGSSASKANLDTFDGYVYAVPLCAWSRYNKASWSYTNQNGGSGRPDGTTHRLVSEDQFIDLRPVVFSERYDLRSAAENTLDRILRGTHHSVFAEAETNYEDTGDPADWVGQGVWGVEVPELWRIVSHGGAATSEAFNYVRDIGLATTNNYSEPGYAAPLAHHDGIRRVFSPQEEVQEVPINIVDVDNSDTTTPDDVISYNHLTKTITLSTTSSDLSGYAAGTTTGVIINDTYPRLYWRGSRQPVKLSTIWSGLGTKTATAVIDDSWPTYEPNGTIDGYIDLLYPECTGIARPLSQADYVEFDDGADNYNTIEKGNPDGSPDTADIIAWKLSLTTPLEPGFDTPTGICKDPTGTYIYVCDSANSRVVKLLASDLSQVAQYPTVLNFPVVQPANPNTQLTFPIAVACNAAGKVFVADREDHRVVRLDANLTTFEAAFGSVATPGNDPTSTTTLKNPEGVTVDSIGNVYISDTGQYRLVKTNSSLTYTEHIGDGISGAGQSQFIEPTGLGVGSVDGDEFVYVADSQRLVQVDAANMTVENILGSEGSPSVQNFFRHVTADFFGMAEDVNGNRYMVAGDRKMLMRFDASWNLTHTFGEDGVMGWDEEHLSQPRDLIYDPVAGLVFVGDWKSPNQPNGSRILVFDATNLELRSIKTLNMHRGIFGLAYYHAGGGPGAKLYCCAGDEVFRFSVGAVGTRWDASTWTLDWEIDGTTFGTPDDWIMAFDMDVSVNNDFFVLMDVWTGRMSKVDISGGSPGSITHCQVAPYTNWPPEENGAALPGMGTPSLCITPDNNGVYIFGAGSVIDDPTPSIRLVDLDSMTIVDEYTDATNWPNPETHPVLGRFTKDGNLYVAFDTEVMIYQLHAATGDYGGFIPTPGPYPGALSSITQDYIGRLSQTPVNYRLNLDVGWENIKSVHFFNDLLYVCDVEGNTITVIGADSLVTKGYIGNSATVGRGKGAFTGPTALCAIGDNIFFTDTNSNRVMKGYRSYPSIEKNTGRLQYLTAPPSTAQVTIQARYTPYQGIWGKISTNNALYGRHFVTDNNMLYITTLGRGTLIHLEDDSGAGFYANMIARIPTAVNCPEKNPRVSDEYLFAPEPLPVISGMTSPFIQLPIINRYPSTAHETYPVYGSGSRFDFNRFFLLQGPGKDWPDDNTVPEDFMRRGYLANGRFPGFDTLITFPLQTMAIPRMIFGTMVVEIDGEGYLVIYTSYSCSNTNILNDGSPISADVFRLYGNPGIKTRY